MGAYPSFAAMVLVDADVIVPARIGNEVMFAATFAAHSLVGAAASG